MEFMMVKNEDKPLSVRRPICGEDSETEVKAKRCVKKRRRKDPSVTSLNSDDHKQQTALSTTVKRSSKYRGVSRHRWTGRFEAHLWDKLSWNATQKKKGKQVYLGAYDEEEAAARAYDLAAIKYWGISTFINFPISDYEKEIEFMQSVTKEEYLAFLRRKSSGFSRGVSKYRGVARHHHNGRWEARIGRVFGNKYLYLGTYSTQEEAAKAYDRAAIEYRGVNAVTNFDLSTYIRWLKPGAASNPIVNPGTETVKDVRTMQSMTNYSTTSAEKSPPIFTTNPFTFDFLNSPQTKQIVFKTQNTLNNVSRSSSPTALGLLLRSSIFRQLVEKNSNVSEDETDGEDQPRVGYEDEEFGQIFDEISNISFGCGFRRDNIEQHEREHFIS